jgi:hypothetical protein
MAKDGEGYPLSDYVTVRGPGETPQLPSDVDGERRPGALTTTRTRLLPLDWPSLLAAGSISVATEIEVFRQEFERSLGMDEPLASRLVRHWIPPGELAHYTEVEVTGGRFGERPKVTQTALPPAALVLSHGTKRGVGYWLRPRDGAVLGADNFAADYNSAWAAVLEVVTVLDKNEVGSRGSRVADRIEDYFNNVVIRPPFPSDPGPIYEQPIFRSLGHGVRGAPTASRKIDPRPILPLPWDNPVPESERLPPADARRELEASWHSELTLERLQPVLFRTDADTWYALDRAAFIAAGEYRYFYGLKDAWNEAAHMVAVPAASWILRLRGRHYVVHARGAAIDFYTTAGYEQAWSAIERLEQVTKRDLPSFTHAFEAPLHLENIVREYAGLRADLGFAKRLSDLADKLSEADQLKAIGDVSDEVIARFAERYRLLKLRAHELRERIRLLQTRAAQLGYHLAVGDLDKDPAAGAPATLPNGSAGLDGSLYQQSFYWTTYSTLEPYVIEIVFWIHGVVRVVRHETRYRVVYRQRQIESWQRLPLEQPAWVVARDKAAAAGLESFIFDLSAGGLVSDRGMSLSQVMELCDQDEGFRRRVALFIPQYEDRFTRGLVKTGYDVVLRPEPGYVPVALPGVHLREETSYRLAWRGVEIGELLATIPLAPGESRRIDLARQFSRYVERTESVTTALDVTATSSYEITDAIEDTHRREREQMNTSNWNASAKVSGMLDGITGSVSGGGGGSSSETTKDYAQQIRRTASKAARELRQSQKQEVRTTSTERIELRNEEKTSSTVTNINQGRTLNLFFHQLNNVFEGGLFLEDVRFLFTPSVEAVANTRIRDTRTFRLREVGAFVEAFAADALFVRYVAAGKRSRMKRLLLRAAVGPILSEYLELDPAALGGKLAPEQVDRLQERQLATAVDGYRLQGSLSEEARAYLLAGELPTPAAEPAKPAGTAGPDMDEVAYRLELAIVEGIFDRLVTTNLAIEPHVLVVPSKATYVDSVLGVNPATEPYSEEMRVEEAANRRGEARLKHAQALLLEAQAFRLSMGGTTDGRTYPLAEPAILAVELHPDKRRLEVRLSAPLPAVMWEFETESLSLPVPADQAGRDRVVTGAAAADLRKPSLDACVLRAVSLDFVIAPRRAG